MWTKIKNSWTNYWKRAFNYHDKSSILDFWVPVFMNVIIYFIFQLCAYLDDNISQNNDIDKFLSIILLIYLIANIFPLISVGYRRYLDIGFPGYAYLIVFALYVIASFTPLLWLWIVLFLAMIVSTLIPHNGMSWIKRQMR